MAAEILVVGGDEPLQEALRHVFQDVGWAPVFCLPQDVASHVEPPPALVLVDLCRDEVRALGALEFLRSRPATVRTPVLLLGTGRERIKDPLAALKARADDFMLRPAPASLLVQRVARYLKVEQPLLKDGGQVIPGLPNTAAPATVVPAALGPFEEGGLPPIVWECIASRWTGCLTIWAEGAPSEPRRLMFQDGNVVQFQSERLEDSLENFLHLKGWLQERPTSVRVGVSSRKAALALVESGVLKSGEAAEVTRQHLVDRVVSLMETHGGRHARTPLPGEGVDPMTLEMPAAALFWKGIRHKYPLSRLQPLLGGPSTVVEASLSQMPPFQLGADEERVVARLASAEKLGNLAALGMERVYQVAFLLCATGHGRVVAKGLDTGAMDAATRSVEEGIDRARLAELARRSRETSYLALLGVTPSSTRVEVEDAVATLRTALQRSHPGATGERKAAVEEVLAALDDAARVLLDERLRRIYQQGLGV